MQGQISLTQWRQRQRRRIAKLVEPHQGQGGDRPARCRDIPFLKTAQSSNHQTSPRRRRFKVLRFPGSQNRLCFGACGRFRIQAKQAQCPDAMMGKVGMYPNPAVTCFVQPGKNIPQCRCVAIQAKPARAFQRRVRHVD